MTAVAEALQMRKPKTSRGKRAMEKRAPKVRENAKTQLVLRGSKTSPIISDVLKDLHKLKHSQSTYLPRRMGKRLFEDSSSFEFLCQKNDTSFLAFGNHTKKRPSNLTLARLYDFSILDAYEFGVDEDTFRPMEYFTRVMKEAGVDEVFDTEKTFRYDSKPLLVFQGEDFASDTVFKGLRNFFVDYLHGVEMRRLNLMGIDRVYVISAKLTNVDGADGVRQKRQLFIRHYRVYFTQSRNPKLPAANLEEIGPRMDLTLRRHEHASDEVQKDAREKPEKQDAHKRKPKQKNVTHNEFGERTGRIHINRADQDLTKLKFKKIRVLRKIAKEAKVKKRISAKKL
jgi:ribosome production factor 2